MVIDDQTGSQHQREPDQGEPDARHEQQQKDESSDEPGQSPTDAAQSVRGHRCLRHTFDQARVFLGEPSLDLLEDALLVRCQRHGRLS
jgi:hypothetical protein